MAAIGTICLMLMAVESIRQTSLSRASNDNLKRVVNWIENHVEHEAKYKSQAEQLLKQVQLKDLQR